ncbi:MAG: MFS transporter [Dehalococcoidia bacterium]|nr:MFS transporter [Dehalococcoidia bacterium]
MQTRPISHNGVASNGGLVVDGAGATSGTRPRMGTFFSFRYRDYTFLWSGTVLASAGMWIQQTTMGWIVYDLTRSSSMLGAISAVGGIPTLLIVPLAGVAADRFSRRWLMLVSQIAICVLTLALGIGLALHAIAIWHLFAFTALFSIGMAFNQPVRQTVVFDLVPREAIPNAVAMNSAGFNSTRALGPIAAGFLIAAFGPAGNFFIQAGLYLLVVFTILFISFPKKPPAHLGSSSIMHLAEGFQYVAKDSTARMLILLGLIPPLLVMPAFMSLMPVFAKDIFQAGPQGLGILLSANGLGGLLGALFTASLGNFDRRGALQLGALLGVGLAGVAFAFSSSLPVAMSILVAAGFCSMVYMTTNQTALQMAIPDRMRGRVTSIMMLNMGLMPIGGLIAGVGADIIGAPATVATMCGITLVITVLVTLFVPRIRNLRLSQIASRTPQHMSPPEPEPVAR